MRVVVRVIAAVIAVVSLASGVGAQANLEQALELLRLSASCPIRGITREQESVWRAVSRRHSQMEFQGDVGTLKIKVDTEERYHELETNEVTTRSNMETFRAAFSDIGLITVGGAELTVYCLSGKCVERTWPQRNKTRETSFSLEFCDGEVAENARLAIRTLRGPAKLSLWMHNDSIMYIQPNGAERRIYYYKPRPALIERGVTEGSELFWGALRGTIYEGRANVFTRGCYPESYSVRGEVLDGGRLIRMRGKAPVRNAECNFVRTRDDILEFTFLGNDDSF